MAFLKSRFIRERGELVPIQTLVTQPSVKRLIKEVFHGLFRSNEAELEALPIGLHAPNDVGWLNLTPTFSLSPNTP
jgi:hypothetical protein